MKMDNDHWLKSLKEVVTKLHSFSSWLFYMGIIYIVGSISVGTTKAIQFIRVQDMHSIAKGNNQKIEELEKQFMLVYQDYQDEQDDNAWISKWFGDIEDKRAVLMGNGGTLKTVLVFNMITAALFFMQGFYMFTVVGKTKKTVETIESRPIEECAQTLQSKGMKPQDPKRVHNKTKNFFCMAIFTMICLLIGSGLRILVTSDSMDREYRIVSTFTKMKETEDQSPKASQGDDPTQTSKNKKRWGVQGQDSLSWNLIRVMKEREEQGAIPAGDDLFSVVSNPDVADSESNHPIMWSTIYLVVLTIVTRQNMYNFFNFSTYQEKMVRLLISAPGSKITTQ